MQPIYWSIAYFWTAALSAVVIFRIAAEDAHGGPKVFTDPWDVAIFFVLALLWPLTLAAGAFFSLCRVWKNIMKEIE